MRKHFNYANVVATFALVFAMTGGAFAAGLVKKNSVNSGSIRNNTITTSDVKDKSLRARDFKSGELLAGATGAAGAPGAAKAFGFINADGTVNTARSSSNIASRLNAPGQYCLTVTGVEVKTAVVSLVAGTSKNSDGDNEWGAIDWNYAGGSSNPCNPGELVVRTFYAITPGPDVQYSNAEFSIIIE